MQTNLAIEVYNTWIATEKNCRQTAMRCHISERYVYTGLKVYCERKYGEKKEERYQAILKEPHKQPVRQKYTKKVVKTLESKSAYDEDFEYIQLLLEDSNKVENILEAISLMQEITNKLLKEME